MLMLVDPLSDSFAASAGRLQRIWSDTVFRGLAPDTDL
jgi:hypothetical protein